MRVIGPLVARSSRTEFDKIRGQNSQFWVSVNKFDSTVYKPVLINHLYLKAINFNLSLDMSLKTGLTVLLTMSLVKA